MRKYLAILIVISVICVVTTRESHAVVGSIPNVPTNYANTVSSELISGNWSWADDVGFRLGTDADWSCNYDATNEQFDCSTTATNGSADGTGMFRIRVNDGSGALDDEQTVFEVVDDAADLFTIDEDGDVVANATVTGTQFISSSADKYHFFNAANSSGESFTEADGDTYYDKALNYWLTYDGSTWEHIWTSGSSDTGDYYTTGELNGKLDINDYTTTTTVAAQDTYGGIVTNSGASGAIVLTLPTAVKGMNLRIQLTVAQDVDINPQNADQILGLTDAAGDAISSDASVGSYVNLISFAAGQWSSAGSSGTWTDVN